MKKKLNISHKLITIISFIVLAFVITAAVIFTQNGKADTVAKTVLTKAYGAKLQDYEILTNALTQSLGDNRIALDYMHTVYGEQITENGCKIFLNNRITSALIAHDENSNLQVSFIKLDPEDAIKGSKNYAFTIQVKAENNASKTFTFKGHIRLIQEDGQWKVDGVSPVY